MTATGAIIGYARTSTADQQAGLDAQIVELQAAGCTRIFSEQISGTDTARTSSSSQNRIGFRETSGTSWPWSISSRPRR